MTVNDLAALAREHLAPEIAAAWTTTVRPAVALVEAVDGEPVVARLGGDARLPAGHSWPVGPGQNPLSYVGELDLAALAAAGYDADIPLPRTGRLAFFHYEAPDSATTFVGDPAAWGGARVLHLPDGGEQAAGPEGTQTYTEQLLAARQTASTVDWEHHGLAEALGVAPEEDFRRWLDHPVNATEFTDASARLLGDGPYHQVGGWPAAVQGPPEYDVATTLVARHAGPPDGSLARQRPNPKDVHAEADGLALLFQVDSYADVGWGDAGSLYWFVRRDDLASGDFTDAYFTWQSC